MRPGPNLGHWGAFPSPGCPCSSALGSNVPLGTFVHVVRSLTVAAPTAAPLQLQDGQSLTVEARLTVAVRGAAARKGQCSARNIRPLQAAA
jgi:hypothetical protein